MRRIVIQVTKFNDLSLVHPCSQESNMGHQKLYWSCSRKFSQGSLLWCVCLLKSRWSDWEICPQMCHQSFHQYVTPPSLGWIKCELPLKGHPGHLSYSKTKHKRLQIAKDFRNLEKEKKWSLRNQAIWFQTIL